MRRPQQRKVRDPAEVRGPQRLRLSGGKDRSQLDPEPRSLAHEGHNPPPAAVELLGALQAMDLNLIADGERPRGAAAGFHAR